MAGPIFRTHTAAATQPCSYQLSIRAPGQVVAEIATYTFPLSPAALRTVRSGMSTYNDTQGTANSQGVTRVVDRYGLSPPMFSIQGTTGWDYHLSDGYILTGLQSLQLLAQFLARYATLNELQRAAGNPDLYTLEFYDYFLTQFWQIEPVGPQGLRQSADRPLLTYYEFNWIGVAPIGLPVIGEIDAIANTLLTPAQQAAVNAARTISAALVAYGPTGAVGSALSAL